MKKTFEIEVDVQLSRGKPLTEVEVTRYLRTADFIPMATEVKVGDITDDDDKEDEVYNYLLDKIKNEGDADACNGWACALDRFCDAVRTKAGG